MLHALKARGPWKAAFITALIFGLTHALNALAGKSLLDGMLQIFYATAIGFAYAALVFKTNLLWPLVLTHFLTDFAYFVQKPGFEFTSFWQSFMVAGLAVVFTAYGVYLLRRESRLVTLTT
jgi:membrane protease YdiL (CAAX protease family)